MGSVLSKEFHLRTITGRRYNFCGPNTRLSRRMTPNGTVRDGSEPINRIDEISMRHDIAYRNADEGRGTRLQADADMLRELDELDDEDLLAMKGWLNVLCNLLSIFCIACANCFSRPPIFTNDVELIQLKAYRFYRCRCRDVTLTSVVHRFVFFVSNNST